MQEIVLMVQRYHNGCILVDAFSKEGRVLSGKQFSFHAPDQDLNEIELTIKNHYRDYLPILIEANTLMELKRKMQSKGLLKRR